MPEQKATKWYSDFLAKDILRNQKKAPATPEPPPETPPGELPLEPGIHTVGTTQYKVVVNKDGSRSIRVLRKLSPRPAAPAEPGGAVGQFFSGLGTMGQAFLPQPGEEVGGRSGFETGGQVLFGAAKGLVSPLVEQFRRRELPATTAAGSMPTQYGFLPAGFPRVEPSNYEQRMGALAASFAPPFTELARPREQPMTPEEFALQAAMFLPMAPAGRLLSAPLKPTAKYAGTLAEAGAYAGKAKAAEALVRAPGRVLPEAGLRVGGIRGQAGAARLPLRTHLPGLTSSETANLRDLQRRLSLPGGVNDRDRKILDRLEAKVAKAQQAAKPAPGQAPLAEAVPPAAKIPTLREMIISKTYPGAPEGIRITQFPTRATTQPGKFALFSQTENHYYGTLKDTFEEAVAAANRENIRMYGGVPLAAAAPKPKVKVARAPRKLPSVEAMSDFDPVTQTVVRRGNRTFIVDKTGQRADTEVVSDVLMPQFEANLRALTPEQRIRMEQTIRSTPNLSQEGKAERLAILAEMKQAAAPAAKLTAKEKRMAAQLQEDLSKAFGKPRPAAPEAVDITGKPLAQQAAEYQAVRPAPPPGAAEGVGPPSPAAAQPPAAGVPPVGRAAGGKGKVPPGGKAPPPPPSGDYQAVVQKIIKGVRLSKGARTKTEAMRSAELRRRVASAAAIYGKKEGFEKLASLGALKGEMPIAEIEAIKLTPTEAKTLVARVDEVLPRYFDRVETLQALQNLTKGVLPQRAQLAALEYVFGPDLVRTLIRVRQSWGEKAFELAMEILNIPRTLLAAAGPGDISGTMRQAGFLSTAYPREFRDAFIAQLKAYRDPAQARAAEQWIVNHPAYDLAKRSKLDLTLKTFRVSAGFGEAIEEPYISSRLLTKVPILGRIVEASDDAYTVMTNKIRMEAFASEVAKYGRDVPVGFYNDMGRNLNIITGRGVVPKGMTGAMTFFNSLFFSPRLTLSRLQIPFTVASRSPEARKLAINALVKYTGSVITLMALGDLFGKWNVEWSPIAPSSDWMKIKMGNTRIDPWMGMQQPVRLVLQILQKQKKTLAGEVVPVSAERAIAQFFRYKLHPTLSFGSTLYEGESVVGEKATPGSLLKSFINLAYQDTIDAVQENGLFGILAFPVAAVGIGVQTFESETPQERRMRQFQERLENPERRMQQRMENFRKRLESVPAGAR